MSNMQIRALNVGLSACLSAEGWLCLWPATSAVSEIGIVPKRQMYMYAVDWRVCSTFQLVLALSFCLTGHHFGSASQAVR